jgi:hypothetical protein
MILLSEVKKERLDKNIYVIACFTSLSRINLFYYFYSTISYFCGALKGIAGLTPVGLTPVGLWLTPVDLHQLVYTS